LLIYDPQISDKEMIGVLKAQAKASNRYGSATGRAATVFS
jgi:hypothetical protein